MPERLGIRGHARVHVRLVGAAGVLTADGSPALHEPSAGRARLPPSRRPPNRNPARQEARPTGFMVTGHGLRAKGALHEPRTKSGGEPPHSTRFAMTQAHPFSAQRLECAGSPALSGSWPSRAALGPRPVSRERGPVRRAVPAAREAGQPQPPHGRWPALSASPDLRSALDQFRAAPQSGRGDGGAVRAAACGRG